MRVKGDRCIVEGFGALEEDQIEQMIRGCFWWALKEGPPWMQRPERAQK